MVRDSTMRLRVESSYRLAQPTRYRNRNRNPDNGVLGVAKTWERYYPRLSAQACRKVLKKPVLATLNL